MYRLLIDWSIQKLTVKTTSEQWIEYINNDVEQQQQLKHV